MKRGMTAAVGFLVSATLFVTAAVVRWWPCGWPVTRASGDSSACMLRQDDSYERTMLVEGGPHEWLITVLIVAHGLFAVGTVLAYFAARGNETGLRRRFVVGMLSAVLLVTPFVDYFLVAPLVNGFYMSHDSHPWLGISPALGALLASAVVLRELPPDQRSKYIDDKTVSASTTLVNNA